MIVAINGINYHIERVGTGFPLVLLHGFTGSGANWLPFVDKWANDASLMIVDIIGHGKTESPLDVERYRMDAVVEDLASILDTFHLEQADFLGYSMGGRLALSFAVKYPEKVRKLILESASPGLKTEAERAIRRENDAKLAAMIREEGMSKFVDYWERIPLFHSQLQLPSAIREQIRNQRLSNSVVGLSNSLLGMGTGSQNSCWDALEQLSCEVLLITGELDEKYCDLALEMKKKVKNSKWIKVDSCGHTIHVEQDEKFGTIVREFLKNSSC